MSYPFLPIQSKPLTRLAPASHNPRVRPFVQSWDNICPTNSLSRRIAYLESAWMELRVRVWLIGYKNYYLLAHSCHDPPTNLGLESIGGAGEIYRYSPQSLRNSI